MNSRRNCLKGLWTTLYPVRFKVLLCGFIYLGEAVLSLAFVWFSKRVVDIATGALDQPLTPSVLIVVALMALQVVFRVISRYYEDYITVKAKISMRERLFDRAVRSEWKGKEKFHSADVVNRLEEDIRVISEFLCSTLPSAFVTLCQLIGATVLLFVLSPSLGWILVWIMPVAVLGARLFFRRTRMLTSEIRALDGRIQSYMQEFLLNRLLIKTLGSVNRVESGLDELLGQEKSKTVSRMGYTAISRSFMNIGFSAGYLLAFLWGVYGISDGSVSYGLMVAFLQLVGQVQRPVAGLAACVPAFIRVLSSEERVLDIEEMKVEPLAEDRKIDGPVGIRVENITFSYEDEQNGCSRKVFDNFSCDFRPGTMTAICGPTGRGKSTLASLVLGLIRPQSGSVMLYPGEVVSDNSTRCNFLYVPQGNTLLSGTIRENLRLSDPDAGEEKMWEVLHLAAADFVRELPKGLDTQCSEVGRGLSEGQAQRIAIARALLREGGVLILDEATSALDPETEQLVLDRIYSRYHSEKTILCITHRPAAGALADSVLNI